MNQLVVQDKFVYMIAHPLFYETIERIEVNWEDFCEPLSRRLPEGWELFRSGIWVHCMRPDIRLPSQGWKIHLSATPALAAMILMTVAPVLFDKSVPFKFLADRMTLLLSLSKRWHRGGAGKFMTVYPKDVDECRDLLETLSEVTAGFNGPYILSDRRYKNSRIVYYRYGGFRRIRKLRPDGTQALVIAGEGGEYLEDERAPAFRLPPGIQDPFQPELDTDESEDVGLLKNGRYKVERVLTFSNSGGVYRARDNLTGDIVVIKEARPATNVSARGQDAVNMLIKENRILKELKGTGIAPEPIDFFFDWEHAFLVMEYISDARDFRGYMNGICTPLFADPSKEDANTFIRKYKYVIGKIIEYILEFHRRNIILGDLSINNILIKEDGDNIRVFFIDFEGAHERGVDIPSHLFTPGFASIDEEGRSETNEQDDYYGIGSLMLAGFFPINQLLVVDRNAGARFIDAMARDFFIPGEIVELMKTLLSKRGDKRTLEHALDVMKQSYDIPEPAIDDFQLHVYNIEKTVNDVMKFIESSADYNRSDRLFPADPEIFGTNPLSLAFGACGVGLVQWCVKGAVPEDVLRWIEKVDLQSGPYAAGLYRGLSGIAWFWLELGMREKAEKVMALARERVGGIDLFDVFDGLAGYGLANLRFFLEYNDELYLKEALWAGREIINKKNVDDSMGCYWKNGEEVAAGYGHGVAGICNYLLYLYQLTGVEEFLSVGMEGLAWLKAKGVVTRDEGLSWKIKEHIPSVTPYWRWGTAGVAFTFLRYWRATKEPSYSDIIHQSIIDCSRKYAIFPGYFFGLSGICEFLFELEKESPWRDVAQKAIRRVLSGTMLFAMSRENGVAFPGESLARISCDFGTGSAGVAYIFDRYLNQKPPLLQLNALLDSSGCGQDGNADARGTKVEA